MKKGFLIFLMGIVSFLGINTVSAEEIYLEYDTNINTIKPYIDEIGYETLNNAINENINYYNENLSNEYPYYFISLMEVGSINSNYTLNIILTAIDTINSNNYNTYFNQSFQSHYLLTRYSSSVDYKQIKFDYTNNEFIEINSNGFPNISLFSFETNNNLYNPYNYYYSNFNLYYKGSLLTEEIDTLNYLNPDDTFYIPKLNDSNLYSVHKANTDFLIEPYYLYDDNESLKEENYTSINLNDFPYVALSLKDYNTIPENNSSVYTNIWVKGQLCITPVYNYGMTERKDVLTGTQVQRCSSYYNDFTSTRMYLLKTDVENHSIYYLKAYDTSKENIVKIDTSVFDISYITEETKDNPYVNITGKQYPTIAYDKLTDTATKSEDEDYISGVTCPVGDFNCYNEYNSSNVFTDLFDKPLEMLKSVWGAIVSIFELITQFIVLLPPTMQGFLYFAFGIGIILGVIKILL